MDLTNAEPPWLTRLRKDLAGVTDPGRHEELGCPTSVEVGIDDLREAINAAEQVRGLSPGGAATVRWGAVSGLLTIDFQKFIRWVHCTPAEAKHFAETILRQLHNAPHVAPDRRLPSAQQN